jgi:anti-sigma B factor antagonist
MTAPPRHFFEWEEANGVAIVRFTTTLLRDDRIIRQLFDQLDRQLVQAGKTKVLMNFAGLEAFASYAIGQMIALNDKLRRLGGRLALCELVPMVDEIIDVMGLRKRFAIYRSEREALESFA